MARPGARSSARAGRAGAAGSTVVLVAPFDPGPADEVADVGVACGRGRGAEGDDDQVVGPAPGARDETRAGAAGRAGLDAVVALGAEQSIGVVPDDVAPAAVPVGERRPAHGRRHAGGKGREPERLACEAGEV